MMTVNTHNKINYFLPCSSLNVCLWSWYLASLNIINIGLNSQLCSSQFLPCKKYPESQCGLSSTTTLLSCNENKQRALLSLFCGYPIALPDFFGSTARCCLVESLHCSGYTTNLWKFYHQACISSFLLPVTNPCYILLSFKRPVTCRHV